MGITKKISLKNTFRRFLICLLSGLGLSVIIPFLLMVVAANRGLVTLANNNERQIEALIPILTATPEVSDIQLPVGTKFLRVDKSYEYIDTNMNAEEKERALIFAKTGLKDTEGKVQLIFVPRNDEYIILQYMIGSQFQNPWLNQYLPPPEILLISVMVISSLGVCIFLTAHFAKGLRKELTPILDAMKEIETQNLDFKVGHSKISEFENVIVSFDNMRNSLKESLEQQWRAEKSQREQIASLAHDLKTPLTIVQGNIDLLDETQLSEEQRNYLQYAMNGSEQMKQYIKLLIDISRAATGYQLKKEQIEFEQFWEHIISQAEWICREKNLKLKCEQKNTPVIISADGMLLERAIMNIISNASDYAPTNTEVAINADEKEGYLRITVIDHGRGFSDEAIKHAHEKFYMGDLSRSSKMHYGMGLYIADMIIKQHDGALILGNSKETQGAEVIIKIPL